MKVECSKYADVYVQHFKVSKCPLFFIKNTVWKSGSASIW